MFWPKEQPFSTAYHLHNLLSSRLKLNFAPWWLSNDWVRNFSYEEAMQWCPGWNDPDVVTKTNEQNHLIDRVIPGQFHRLTEGQRGSDYTVRVTRWTSFLVWHECRNSFFFAQKKLREFATHALSCVPESLFERRKMVAVSEKCHVVILHWWAACHEQNLTQFSAISDYLR